MAGFDISDSVYEEFAEALVRAALPDATFDTETDWEDYLGNAALLLLDEDLWVDDVDTDVTIYGSN